MAPSQVAKAPVGSGAWGSCWVSMGRDEWTNGPCPGCSESAPEERGRALGSWEIDCFFFILVVMKIPDLKEILGCFLFLKMGNLNML